MKQQILRCRRFKGLLCRRRLVRLIRILPLRIPSRRFSPESTYVALFAENCYFEIIGRGNDERNFVHGTFLGFCAKIIEVATADEGLSLYWKANRPQVVKWRK